jgi:PAS domain S-box-containing protein
MPQLTPMIFSVRTQWLACVRAGEVFEDEVRFRRADGQHRWHLQRGAPLRDEDGNILKWYGVLTDIEDRTITTNNRSGSIFAGDCRR